MRSALLFVSCIAASTLAAAPRVAHAQRIVYRDDGPRIERMRFDIEERVARRQEEAFERAERAERTRERARERTDAARERRERLAADREFARVERAERIRDRVRIDHIVRVRPLRVRW